MLQTFLLIAWFALPVLVWGAMLCVGRRVHPVLVVIVCLAAMFAGTFILANYVWAIDAQLSAEIDKYAPGTPRRNVPPRNGPAILIGLFCCF